ncbi:MAG TPA: PilZ domain-containing protein [Dissulfurispiraceae bacterium]
MGKGGANSRNFFRVDAYIPIICFPVSSEERDNLFSDLLDKDSVPALRKSPLKKVDLSGGGISFETPNRYATGDLVEINMVLDKVHEGVIVVHGEVVRAEPLGGSFMLAVKFISVDERIRDLIIRYVFAREREIIAEKRVGWL